MTRNFTDLSAPEVLALAIRVEYANAGRLKVLADQFEDYDEKLQALFLRLRNEELEHADHLNQAWSSLFRTAPKPKITEEDVRGVIESVEVDHGEHGVFDDLRVEDVIRIVRSAEVSARDFYEAAALACPDRDLRTLYMKLVRFEESHIAVLDRFLESRAQNQGAA
jgi:rubrerythrin